MQITRIVLKMDGLVVNPDETGIQVSFLTDFRAEERELTGFTLAFSFDEDGERFPNFSTSYTPISDEETGGYIGYYVEAHFPYVGAYRMYLHAAAFYNYIDDIVVAKRDSFAHTFSAGESGNDSEIVIPKPLTTSEAHAAYVNSFVFDESKRLEINENHLANLSRLNHGGL